MTNTKTTYISALNAVLTAIKDQTFENITQEDVDKLVALGMALEKRNSRKSDKPTKKQSENYAFKVAIKEVLADHDPMKCGDIATLVGISGQKCSALLSQMVKDGDVVKSVGEKRVTLFSLSEGE